MEGEEDAQVGLWVYEKQKNYRLLNLPDKTRLKARGRQAMFPNSEIALLAAVEVVAAASSYH